MKKIILVIVLMFSFSGCKVQDNSFKLKTIENNHFKIKYPNSWIKFGAFGHVNLAPKKIKKDFPEDELNNISVNNNLFYADKFVGIEETINIHSSTLVRFEKSKHHKLFKIKDHPLYIYKTESRIQYKNDLSNFKRLEFYYVIDNRLDYIRFQMREELFSLYINEAMLIINSFQPK